MVARSASGSVASPSAVEPVRSQKTTVTVFRTSRRAGASVRGAAQLPQNLNPSGFSWPHEGQRMDANLVTRMDWVLELAENANTYTPLGPHDERVVTDRYVLWMGRGDDPGWNVAQRFRLRADELDEVRVEIHGHLRARSRTACSWEIGSHAQPADLVDRLLALGLVDDEPTPLAVGMVLTEPPAEPPPDVEVRRVETAEEAFAADRIAAVA